MIWLINIKILGGRCGQQQAYIPCGKKKHPSLIHLSAAFRRYRLASTLYLSVAGFRLKMLGHRFDLIAIYFYGLDLSGPWE